MSSNVLSVDDEVLSVIRNLDPQNAILELTKSFKGIMVRQDVSFLGQNPDGAAFRTADVKMCAVLERDVYLHHRLFPKPVMARLKSVNTSQGMFVLSGFAYTDIEWKERQHERVQPKHPTYVTLHYRRKAIRASMGNISVNGMGILAYKIFERGMSLKPGSNIHLDFQLPPDHNFIALKGRVIHLNSIVGDITKIGIRLFPTAKEARLLAKYIIPRKQEIMEELNRAYWELIQPMGVKSLYF